MAKLTKNEARLRRHKRARRWLVGTNDRPRLCVFAQTRDLCASD